MNYPRSITVIIFVLCYSIASAQKYTPDVAKEGNAACMKLTKELILPFQLNEKEYISLKAINMSYLTKVAETNLPLQFAESDTKASLYELEAQYELELLALFTPHQLAAYNEFKVKNMSVIDQLAAILAESERRKTLFADIGAN